MSSILKALKKLEHEKAVRKPDSFRINAEILRGGSHRSVFSTSASLAAIALFLCGVGATYLFMKHVKTPAPVQPSLMSMKKLKGEPLPGTTLLPVSALPAAEAQPRPFAKIISVAGKAETSPQPTDKRQQIQRVLPSEIVPHAVSPEPKPVSPPAPVAPVVVTHDKTVFKVNGIAFQDGADSVAVVNGIAVSKGSIIEGIRVEEIQKDRVRFSRGGDVFYIILDKSN